MIAKGFHLPFSTPFVNMCKGSCGYFSFPADSWKKSGDSSTPPVNGKNLYFQPFAGVFHINFAYGYCYYI